MREAICLLPHVDTRPVAGSDGKYVAGDDGAIYCYSDAPTNARMPRPFRVSANENGDGYLYVAVILHGKRITRSVHRLVCEAWYGPPEAGQLVRHLDGNPANNCPGNLRWGTYSQNEADKRRHGRVAEGERHGQVKLTEEGVRIIRAAIPAGLWDVTAAAKVFGVDASTIRRIAAGGAWRHVE